MEKWSAVIVSAMGRFNRVVAVDIPHHVTQRGNGRRFILDCDADRAAYLKLLCENTKLYGVAVIGYCLMPNHIHLIATPTNADGLAEALKQTHGRYACYWNVAHQSSGHVWQGRYYSCPLTPRTCGKHYATPSLIRCELDWSQRRNSGPGRAQPVTAAAKSTMSIWLSMRGVATGPMQLGGEYLEEGEVESKLAIIRQRTHTGRPLGNVDLFKISRRRRNDS
jgi:putative transposase